MASKQKNRKKRSNTDSNPGSNPANWFEANAGKVGAAIAGAVLSEITQSAINRARASAVAEPQVESSSSELSPEQLEQPAKRSGHVKKAKSERGRLGKRMKGMGLNPGKIGIVIANAVLAEVAQAAVNASQSSSVSAEKPADESIKDDLAAIPLAVHDKVEQGRAASSASQDAVVSLVQPWVETGKDIAKTVTNNISATTDLPQVLTDVAGAAAGFAAVAPEDEHKQDKKKSGKKKRKKHGKKS